jgi:hypothetical protein
MRIFAKNAAMKKCFILLLLCVGLSATAQYYQEGSRHNGVDRSLTGQMYEHKKKQQPEKVDKIELSIKKLTEELTLDSFQVAVVQQLLEANKKEEDIVVAQDIPDESKVEKIVALRERTNTKIKEILTPEQLEKFGNLGKKKKK